MSNFLSKSVGKILPSLDRISNKQWYGAPLVDAPAGSSEEYLQIAKKAKEEKFDEIDEIERSWGHTIDQVWLHDLALHTQVVIKSSKICYQHGRLLFSALKKYILDRNAKNLTIVETGTARGYSSLCMAKAISECEGVSGKIFTFDVLPHNFPMYWNCIDDLEGKKSRSELLEKYSQLVEDYIVYFQGDSRITLQKAQFPRVNFAFLDGAHTYEDVMYEFSCVKDSQKSGDCIFFDDYSPSMFPGVVKATDEIVNSFGYDKKEINISEQRGYLLATKK